jgi:uncharacterized membrane protein (DUF373 family)
VANVTDEKSEKSERLLESFENKLKNAERVIIILLIIMMSFAVFISTIELGVILYQELMKAPKYLLNIEELLEIFGFFFMILIGLELLETIRTYLKEDQIHVEVVFLVAMIAISRKVIILDVKKLEPGILYGISGIIIALSAGYFLVKRALRSKDKKILTHNH